ncbi:MAG TPA: hypothetical protein VN668_02010 [Stellaceae bacterium]|nr:hypothetical protein [Stellaceae bacterium]
MIAEVKSLLDRVLGRGEASSTVPPMDGQLKPNQLLERAAVVAEFAAPEDLATDGSSVFVADGKRLLRLGEHGPSEIAHLDGAITALCRLADGGFAVALDGTRLRILGGGHDGKSWERASGAPFVALNAVAASGDGRSLLVTDGSRAQPYERWSHDLMARGHGGRLVALDLAGGGEREIAGGLAYAFGAAPAGAEVWVSESWRHRLVAFGGARPGRTVLENLPVYPSRLSPAGGGGYWLTAFTARTQLVEFVLREPAYCRRMMREIDPRYWIAPRLSSGHTFLEPMQGAHIKTMGILKPWAPPRSYGLVIRLGEDGLPRYSLHSRVDGMHHGVVAAVECRGALYVLAKGAGKILRLPVTAIEEELLP